jgi:4-hydroxythreonine-4-phosphate dehydrogenase/1,2-dihydroxy-3,5-cyclohexadiene-1,4-dicarboxylate dehydrogenase
MSRAASLPMRIGLPIGDPNGVGPEIALRAAAALGAAGEVQVELFADRYIVERECKRLRLAASAFVTHDIGAMPAGDWRPGAISAAAGAATVEYVRAAVQACMAGRIAGIVAAPHCETAVNAAGIRFSGYGPLVAELTDTPADRVFLMLAAQGLRVIHATLHESVVHAVGRITPSLVQSAAGAAREALAMLGVEDPRLCVLGINPHAGEGGLFGEEDERITRPAVRAMQALGWRVDGPAPADVALSERRHDAYVAMLHDQGHIAVKMLSPKGGTALAAGAPLLFASVAHGAAFDLAGQGRADFSAMSRALTLVAGAVQRRAAKASPKVAPLSAGVAQEP